MPLSLPDFCGEMAQYGAKIEAPVNLMPICGEGFSEGFRVGLSEDGTKYVLTMTEKGDTATIITSSNKYAVMEKIFAIVTTNMAGVYVTKGEPPLKAEEFYKILGLSMAQARDNSITQQVKMAAYQEDLLGRLSPTWRQRQAAINAQRVKATKAFFEGDI